MYLGRTRISGPASCFLHSSIRLLLLLIISPVNFCKSPGSNAFGLSPSHPSGTAHSNVPTMSDHTQNLQHLPKLHTRLSTFWSLTSCVPVLRSFCNPASRPHAPQRVPSAPNTAKHPQPKQAFPSVLLIPAHPCRATVPTAPASTAPVKRELTLRCLAPPWKPLFSTWTLPGSATPLLGPTPHPAPWPGAQPPEK